MTRISKVVEKGFSLIELLVVVAIIGVLAAVGTVGYGNYIKQAKVTTTNTNALSVLSYLKVCRAATAAGTLDADGGCSTLSAADTALATGIDKNAYQPTLVDPIILMASTAVPTACSGTNHGRIYITNLSVVPASSDLGNTIAVHACQGALTSDVPVAVGTMTF